MVPTDCATLWMWWRRQCVPSDLQKPERFGDITVTFNSMDSARLVHLL